MAASNERMVSSGRSKRLRVGLERSGSAGNALEDEHSLCNEQDVLMTLPSRSRCCILRRENVSRSPGWLVTATELESGDAQK